MSNTLPNGWVSTTIGDICLPVSKRGPSQERRTFRYIDLGSINNHTKEIVQAKEVDVASAPSRAKQVVRAGDVVFSNVRVYLENIAKVPDDLDGEIASTAFCVIRPALGVEPRYLYYYATSKRFIRAVNELQRGNSPPSVQDGDVRTQPLPLAPFNEQKRVASTLDELFSRIDEGERALARVRKLLERYRQSVLKAAVTGELTRDWREQRQRNPDHPVESGAALLERILAARRAAWEQSELAKMQAKGKPPKTDAWKQKYKPPTPPDTTNLPDLPEGWAWASLDQLASDSPNALTIGPFGSDLKVSDYTASGVPLVFVRNIRNQRFGDADAKYVSSAKAATLARHVARAGDVLITKMGDPPGDACVYPSGQPDAVVTADCIKLTVNRLLSSPDYVAIFVNSDLGKAQIARITRGVAQQKVSLARFRRIGIALPPSQERRMIDEAVTRRLSELADLESDLPNLSVLTTALRQSVLHSAFRGQLVPQDPTDEPASTLLERIAVERAKAPPTKPRRVRDRSACPPA